MHTTANRRTALYRLVDEGGAAPPMRVDENVAIAEAQRNAALLNEETHVEQWSDEERRWFRIHTSKAS
jgi:hypothetical protein